MNTIIGLMIIGAVFALAIILTFMIVGRVYDLYMGIFTAGGRARWHQWNVLQKLLWILGLPLLVIVVPLMMGFQVLFIISVIYLGLSFIRMMFRAIS